MKVGFTGTRYGFSKAVEDSIADFLSTFDDLEEVHHGDCIGSDAMFHDLVRERFPHVKVVVHPPLIPRLRAFKPGDEVHPPRHYKERNRDIVDSCDLLIAVYHKRYPSRGTHYTASYAKSVGKEVMEFRSE